MGPFNKKDKITTLAGGGNPVAMMAGQTPDGGKPSQAGAKPKIRKALIILFWLVVWEVVDRILNNGLVLSGPIDTIVALYNQVQQSDFWLTCGVSFGKIVVGFLMSFVIGFLLAFLAHRVQFIKELLAPIMSLLKTVPMVSFVIMLLIWVGNQALTIYLSFLIVLPLIYTNTLAGLESVDPQMLEMAKIYHLSWWKKFWYIERPAFMPYVISSAKVSIGMSWKSGIMAEVIGTPRPSIGRELYQAKSFLQTADLFAWTVVVIILSLIFEVIFMALIKQLNRPMGKGLLHES